MAARKRMYLATPRDGEGVSVSGPAVIRVRRAAGHKGRRMQIEVECADEVRKLKRHIDAAPPDRQ